ncbi:MAG: TMEM43 family protein [Myxococcota bacterium]
MSDFSEVTTQGWGSRLMGSIRGILVGGLLFLISFPLLWWNEGRAVQTYQSLSEGRGAVVSVAAESVDPANESRLVHLTGTATAGGTLVDETFAVAATGALKLRRTVEMYAWEEDVKTETRKKVGGGKETKKTYSYEKRWMEYPEDSASFKVPEGHQNPEMRYESSRWLAEPVTLGGFALSENLADEISSWDDIPFDDTMLAALPAEVSGVQERPTDAAPKKKKRRRGKRAKQKVAPTKPISQARASGDALYLGADPAAPKVGDLRVRFAQVQPVEVSVIAAQVGTGLSGYQTKAGDTLEMLSMGQQPADAMFQEAEANNAVLTWVLRVIGFLLMFFGVNLILGPFRVFADVIPFLGSFMAVGIGIVGFVVAAPLSLVTIALAWLFYRPLLGTALLVLAVGAVLGLRAAFAKKSAEGARRPARPETTNFDLQWH